MFSGVPGTTPPAGTLWATVRPPLSTCLRTSHRGSKETTPPTQVAFIPQTHIHVLCMQGIWGRGVPGFTALTPPWGR